jgi:hypothetical protein
MGADREKLRRFSRKLMEVDSGLNKTLFTIEAVPWDPMEWNGMGRTVLFHRMIFCPIPPD